MASDAAVSQLAKQIQDLPPLDKYPNCYPEINPVDVYRSHITTLLHGVTGVDPKIIYPALQWTTTLDKGDLVLAVPALRVKGKPDQLGAQWLEKVSCGWPAPPCDVRVRTRSGPPRIARPPARMC